MANKKIDKKLTKALIFSLCCVLFMGAVSVPIFATDTNQIIYFRATSTVDYNGLGFELTYDNNGVPQLKDFDINQTAVVSSNYKPYQFMSTANSVYGFALEFYTLKGARIVVINPEYPDTFVDVFNVEDSVTTIYIDLADYDFVPTIACVRSTNMSSQGVFQRVLIQIDEEYTPTQDYQDGYNAGYQDGYTDGDNAGFEAGYEAGYQDGLADNGGGGFLDIFIDPLGALFGITIFSYEGITITIGSVCLTIFGISLFLAYLKYFAGG